MIIDSDITVHQPSKDHASIHLHAFHEDPRMNNALCGLLVRLLTYTKGPKIRKQRLVNMGPDSEETIKNQLRQLRELGYLKMVRTPMGGGRFDWDYFPYELPQDPETTRHIIAGVAKTSEPKTITGKSPNGQKTPAPGAHPAAMVENHPMDETRSESQNDHRVKNHPWSNAQCINPDLTLSITVNSLSLSGSEDQDLNSSPEIAGVIVPEAPAEVKPVEREEREIDFEAREKEKTRGMFPATTQVHPQAVALINQSFGRRLIDKTPHSESPPGQVDEAERDRMNRLKAKAMADARAFIDAEAAGRSVIAPAPGAPMNPPLPPLPDTSRPTDSALGRASGPLDPAVIRSPEAIAARLALADQKFRERDPEGWAARQKKAADQRVIEAGIQAAGRCNPSEAGAAEAKRKAADAQKVARQAEIERLVAMGPALVETAYRECVDNPTPGQDWHNVQDLKRWLAQQVNAAGDNARDLLALVASQFVDFKGRFHCLKPIINNLRAQGLQIGAAA